MSIPQVRNSLLHPPPVEFNGILSSETRLKTSKLPGYARDCRAGASWYLRVILAPDQWHNPTLIG